MSIKERLRGRLRNKRKQELRNRRKRLLRFEPLEGRMLLSAAGPVNPSQWSFGTWGSGLAFTGSDYVGMTGNGRNQGGDTVAMATPNVIIVDDFYADVYMRVNYVSDSNGDGITMEIGNGDTIRNIVRFIRDANGDLYTHSESASVMSQDTVTISNNASHRIEVNVGVDSASVFIDGQHIVTFAGALPDNASVTFGLRGDKDYVEAKITETNGIFSSFTSDLVVASEPVVEVATATTANFMMVAMTSPKVSVPAILPKEDLPASNAIVSRWTMTDAANLGADSVGNNNLTVANNLEAGTGVSDADSGLDYGTGAHFNRNAKSHLFINDADQTGLDDGGAFTFSTWFKPEQLSIGISPTLISKYYPGDNNVSFRLRVRGDNHPELAVSASGAAYDLTSIIGDTQLQSDTWYQIVAVYDPGRSLAVYVNGVLDGLRTSGIPGSYANRNAKLVLGACENGGGGWGNLVMNDTIIWNKAFSATEATQLYDAYFAMTPVTQEATLNISMFAMPTVQSVPVVEVASFVASVALLVPVVPPMDSLQAQSFAERIARGISSIDTIQRTGATYYDLVRHIDVYAGSNQFFAEYTNGAVELLVIPANLPAGQPHPWAHEVTPIIRNASILAIVPKPAEETGGAFYDVARGIDVYASDGYFLIKYQDDTYGQRPRPSGDFIPRAEDLTIGGEDDSLPLSAFGPSAQVLGISTEGTPTSSSELWYLGTSYVSTLTGELRIAPPGQTFLQHPDSKVILLRPQEDKAVALEKPTSTTMATIVTHSSQKITDYFNQAYGRDPTSDELQTWQKRIDKDGAALLGAMQYAYQQEQEGIDQVMTEIGDLKNKVLGYSSDFNPISFPEIPQYDKLPQIPRVEFEVAFDAETLELVEPVTEQNANLLISMISAFLDVTDVKKTSVLVDGTWAFYEAENAFQEGGMSAAKASAAVSLLQFVYGIPVTALATIGCSTVAVVGASLPCTLTVIGSMETANQDDWTVIESALANWFAERQ